MLPTWSFKTRWKRLCHFYPVYPFLLPALFHSLAPYFLHERAVGQEKFCRSLISFAVYCVVRANLTFP